MTEENTELNTENSGGEPEYTEIEQEAIEMGWVPDGIEGKTNVSAQEFVNRKPIYEEISKLKRHAKTMTKGMDAMREFQTTIRSNERERVIAELNDAKKTALENENYDAVVKIDERIATERETPIEKHNPAFDAWIVDNEWYNTADKETKDYAEIIGSGYANQNQSASMIDVYNHVAEETKKRFPEKFGNPNRERPNAVETAGKGRTKTSKKHSVRDLPEDDRQMMNTILRASPNMSEADYLKEYYGE